MIHSIGILLALLSGAALWTIANLVDNVDEPWDGDSFFIFYLIALLVSFGFGVVAKSHAWLAGSLVVLSMFPVMWVAVGELGPFFLVGLFMLFVMALPAAVASAVGALVSRSRRKGSIN